MSTTITSTPQAPELQGSGNDGQGVVGASQFADFDDNNNYDTHLKGALGLKTKNFILQFGAHKAEICCDLKGDDLTGLLNTTAPRIPPVRFINIWGASDNEKLLGILAKQYKFSTRLKQTILLWDQLSRNGTAARDPEDEEMNKLLKKTLNYFSVDHGRDFLCIGASWLHLSTHGEAAKTSATPHRTAKPALDLVPNHHWAWYVLTSDNTVISIQQPAPGGISDTKLQEIRANIRHLVAQLSVVGIKQYRDQNRILSQKGVRPYIVAKESLINDQTKVQIVEDASRTPHEMATNLFYYLFEDYGAAVTVLNKCENVLKDLSNEVLQINERRNKDRDHSGVVTTLFSLNKQLRQLHHLFESYEKLIDEITKLSVDNDEDHVVEKEAVKRHVSLSRSAHDRFERLNLRLKLLVLNPIDEYLDDKKSLSEAYFNLIAQKDSIANARLTRSATLLAKLSVFFLPISFMTSYFSVQIPDLTANYTGTTYWASFTVVASLSFISLFFFSRLLVLLSDLLDEKIANVQRVTWRTLRGHEDEQDMAQETSRTSTLRSDGTGGKEIV